MNSGSKIFYGVLAAGGLALVATIRVQAETAVPAAPAATGIAVAAPAPAASAEDAKALAQRRQEAMDRGAEALLKQQAPDGSWAKGAVGVSALCANGLLAAGKTIQDPPVRLAIDYILKAQKEDGGIYDDVGLKIYSSSLSLMALSRADPDRKLFAEPIKKVTAYIEKSQWGADESIEKTDLKYGGFGYGKSNRPDMSNTQFALEALKAAGVPETDPVWQRAVLFVSRSQDRSESNDKAFAGRDDGGGVYSPVETKAEMIELPNGQKVFRSYGSMTYAVLKGFIFCNLARDDARIQAAVDWARKHWTWAENPEMGQQGLYYYYLTAARALKAYGEDQLKDAGRVPHDWKAELTQAILSRQRPDGTWVNTQERWFEGEQMAIVPTSYCLMALAECQ